MINIIRTMLRKLYSVVERFIMILRLIITPPHGGVGNAKKDSYYPDAKHKSKLCILLEQIEHIVKYGEINKFYYLYGLDVIGCSFTNKRLLAYRTFMEQRNARNYTKPYSYVCILRNKELFALVCNHYGFRCVHNIGILRSGKLFKANSDEIDIAQLLDQNRHLFFKPIDTECGEGIFCIDRKSDEEYTWNDKPISFYEINSRLSQLNSDILVQTRVIQHAEMNRLYSHSINTLRIVTIMKDGVSRCFSSVLRVGANGNIVDNWAVGGIIINVNDDGTLSKYGFMKPPFGKRMKVHPNTNVPFESFIVPYFKDAVAMCESFHQKISYIWSIGWDVAITPDGPLFIEGNDNWEITLHQTENGLKERWNEFIK